MIESIQKQIDELKQIFAIGIEQCSSNDQLEKLRVDFLGRHGKLTNLMKQLRGLTTDNKRNIGPQLNKLKIYLQELYEQKQIQLLKQQEDEQNKHKKDFDVTLSNQIKNFGSLHIYTQIVRQLENIFISMGYTIANGPEIETGYYNFETLNIPKNHPARDMQDTFWLNIPDMLLRTHTSTVQAHVMETTQLPIAVFAPGRVYRNEATDASHNFMFMQAEGLFIDKKVSMGNLLATAEIFLQSIFERDDLKIRVRPGYFPFVEPGVEIDAQCPFCTDGCSICKKTQWIELLGAGLVHPNVLKTSGIDPKKYSGFAFGFGIDRIAMIKHNIRDIRLFQSSNLEFLKQF
jgi:phenylalanyl-tRNA synthetase alpha chain